jgi:hypothetical protein
VLCERDKFGSVAARLQVRFQIVLSSESVKGLTVKLIRLLMVVAFFGISASLALADGVDPLAGIKSGGGSTGITLTNPNPTFDLITEQSSFCTIAGDVCAVVPSGPDAHMLPVFQNDTGVTLTSITLFIQNTIGVPLTYHCNTTETLIFANCNAVVVAGGTDVIFSGGPGVPAFVFKSDGDPDDSFCAEAGPTGPNCPDDFVGGEFAVDIEGIISPDHTNDLPAGIPIDGTVVTSPEPGSALMLLFGAAAFGLAMLVRRAA